MASSSTTGVSAAALEAFRCRGAIAACLDRVECSDSASLGRMLVVGGGLERLVFQANCREIVRLVESGDNDSGRVPERTRRELWRDPPAIPFADGSFACVIVLDQFAAMPVGFRDAFLDECARVAADAVLMAIPVADPDVLTATREMNELHTALHRDDHPVLARQVEYGLPDLDRVRAGLAARWDHVEVSPIDSLADWRRMESLAMLAGESADLAQGIEPLLGRIDGARHVDLTAPYRWLFAATRRPLGKASAGNGNGRAVEKHDPQATLQWLAYLRSARLEHMLSSSTGLIEERTLATVRTIRDELKSVADRLIEDRQARIRELERLLADMADELRDVEYERAQLRAAKQQLEVERDNLRAAVDDSVQNTSAEVERLRHQIAVMEATRGWKMLMAFRGLRDAIFRRR